MSYLVLARKWRPRKFAEMVGQQHVLRALINALDSDRLHHAFLFTGTRGVGKTTVARIFAKSLNCEQGVGSEPCGECSSCVEIDQGRFVDLIEVDAASRTGVDDTRDLLDNVQYAPARGRYKVYLIDEVHMFSKSSFNALLKTLEEPPPHVKFLLATTDPQKLPATILSRCLQFNLKRLSPEMIRGHLQHLLEQESIPFDASALYELARAADGSMRDALSLLDQAIAFGSEGVTGAEVHEMLGTIDRSRVVHLLEALAAADGRRLLDECAALAELGPDYRAVLEALIDLLHRVALGQVLGTPQENEEGDEETVASLMGALSAEEVQLYYQIALHARRDLPLVPDPRSGLEMALLRMLAFRPAALAPVTATAEALLPESARSEGSPLPPVARAARPVAPTQRQQPAAAPPGDQNGSGSRAAELRAMLGQNDKGGKARSSRAHPATPTAKPPAEGDEEPAPAAQATSPAPTPGLSPFADDRWEQLLEELEITGVTRQLAANCVLRRQQEERWELALDPGCSQLLSDARREILSQALSRHAAAPVRLTIVKGETGAATPEWRRRARATLRQRRAEQLIDSDPVLAILRQRFGAQVIPGSVSALDGLELSREGGQS